jgi:hypothetical protein
MERSYIVDVFPRLCGMPGSKSSYVEILVNNFKMGKREV